MRQYRRSEPTLARQLSLPLIRTASRRVVEGLAAVGYAFWVPVPELDWREDHGGQAASRPAPAVRLSRAERRQWARLVRRLR